MTADDGKPPLQRHGAAADDNDSLGPVVPANILCVAWKKEVVGWRLARDLNGFDESSVLLCSLDRCKRYELFSRRDAPTRHHCHFVC